MQLLVCIVNFNCNTGGVILIVAEESWLTWIKSAEKDIHFVLEGIKAMELVPLYVW